VQFARFTGPNPGGFRDHSAVSLMASIPYLRRATLTLMLIRRQFPVPRSRVLIKLLLRSTWLALMSCAVLPGAFATGDEGPE